MDGVYERIVRQKAEGKYIFLRPLFIFCYLAFAALLAVIILAYCPTPMLIPFITVGLAAVGLTVALTWKFSSIEYEYEICAGQMVFNYVYGKSSRRHALDVDLKAISEVGVYDDIAAKRLEEVYVTKDFLFISSVHADGIHYLLFDDDADKYIVYFEADAEAISIIEKSNPSAVRAAIRESKLYERKNQLTVK